MEKKIIFRSKILKARTYINIRRYSGSILASEDHILSEY